MKGLIFFLNMFTVISLCNPETALGRDGTPGPGTETGGLRLHHYPASCPRSALYEVKVNGEPAFVYNATVASFISFECDDSVEVEVLVSEQFGSLRILPLHLNIIPEVNGETIRFRLPSGAKVYLESDLQEHLFVYGNAVARNKPVPGDPGVHFFRSGEVYEVGDMVLGPGEEVYVEGGAVIRGSIRATRANNCFIGGLGVLDGGYYENERLKRARNMLVEDSRDVSIRDLIMIESQSWVITLYHSEGITIENVKEISHGLGTDGVDIVSSRNVRIRNCIMRNDDDCIAIKSFRDKYMTYSDIIQNSHLEGVSDVRVTGCAVQSNIGGQAFEIGHELMEEPITDIQFVDCDVLGSHGQGGVFGIHNADGATVSNILYENIRVDHYYNKLIDLRIIKSRFSSEEKIGRAEKIVFRDIEVTASRYNPGYSVSLIGGYDEEHQITGVIFDNFRINGVRVTDADQLDLFIKQAQQVTFK